MATFGGEPGSLFAWVEDVEVFDDGLGGGPAVYMGGEFQTAGGVQANYIARWDGAAWSALGTGLNDSPLCMAVFDDGSGPALFVAGYFRQAGGVSAQYIAKWDGTSWESVGGMNAEVVDLLVFDDGGGPALYAGGNFTLAGGVPANRIARYDGASWSAVGTGMDNYVGALVVLDDGLGGGPALHAAGEFALAGSHAANRVARWDGADWWPVGSGLDAYVEDLAVFDDGLGGGPVLFACGWFTTSGGEPVDHVAYWNGTSWMSPGGGMNGVVRELRVFDDGGGLGPALYAAGNFSFAGGVAASRIARWDGANWSPLPGGGLSTGTITSLTSYESSAGPILVAAGSFRTAGTVWANSIALWDGAGWSALGNGIHREVRAVRVFDDGSGPALFAGGFFYGAGDVRLNQVGKWDGVEWSPLADGAAGTVADFAELDDGSGPALYAAGGFLPPGAAQIEHIARWDGASWSSVGAGVPDPVFALAAAQVGIGGGPELYAGGMFTVAGGAPASYIARWDGASWSPLGVGMDDIVWALLLFDDGGGLKLYAGGAFTTAGGVAANRIARWDGTSWSALGSGMNEAVLALAAFDDGLGQGPLLHAGGLFSLAGAVPAYRIARWDGASWAPLGAGIASPGVVQVMTTYDDGTGRGPALYAGGRFSLAGGAPAESIAKWDGTDWSPLGSGVSERVFGLAVFDDGSGSGPALFAGGDFGSAYDSGDSFLAKWGGCAVQGQRTRYCTGKTNSVGCVPFVTVLGLPSVSSPSPFFLEGTDVVPQEGGFVIYGFKKANLDFHGGKLCVGSPFRRTSAKFPQPSGGGCSGWLLRRNFNTAIQNGSDPALTAGTMVFAQWRQRDPMDPAGFGDGLTSAVRFTILP